jgi:hypothetical protein
MVTLWTRMEEIYPHKWSSKLGEPGSSAFATWRQGLAGITPQQIATGLQQCVQRTDAWPPSLPAFRALCQVSPQSLGLPTLESAFRMASRQHPDWHQWHPIVFHARQRVGEYDMVHLSATHTWPRFKAAYQALVEQVLQGEVLTYPQALVPALPQERLECRTSPQVAKTHLSTLRALLNHSGATLHQDNVSLSNESAEPNTERIES